MGAFAVVYLNQLANGFRTDIALTQVAVFHVKQVSRFTQTFIAAIGVDTELWAVGDTFKTLVNI